MAELRPQRSSKHRGIPRPALPPRRSASGISFALCLDAGMLLRRWCLIPLLGTLLACSRSHRDEPRVISHATDSVSERVVFTLVRIDGERLPTRYSDARGRHTLRAGRLTLDQNGQLWFEVDLASDPDTTGGRLSRSTFTSTYRRAGDDSLVFPIEAGRTPEFFARLDGAGGLRVVAHPLPRASGGTSAVSVAAEHGGAHVWEFRVR
jgi:hypothetical protein